MGIVERERTTTPLPLVTTYLPYITLSMRVVSPPNVVECRRALLMRARFCPRARTRRRAANIQLKVAWQDDEDGLTTPLEPQLIIDQSSPATGE